MKMRMKESRFGAPVGVYAGTFRGVKPMDPPADGRPRLGADGNPMEPGIEWQWEITGGEQAGKLVGRITSQSPTTGNACGQLLNGVVGRVVGPDEDVDLDQYVGQSYQVIVGQHKTDPNKTYVTQVVRIKNGQPAPSAPVQAAHDNLTQKANERSEAKKPAPPPPPPPPPPGPPAPLSVTPDRFTERYWVNDGKETREMAGGEIHDLLKRDPLADLKVMTLDQSSGWKTPKDFQLDVPF